MSPLFLTCATIPFLLSLTASYHFVSVALTGASPAHLDGGILSLKAQYLHPALQKYLHGTGNNLKHPHQLFQSTRCLHVRTQRLCRIGHLKGCMPAKPPPEEMLTSI